MGKRGPIQKMSSESTPKRKRPRLDLHSDRQSCSGFTSGNLSFTWNIKRFSTRTENRIKSKSFPIENSNKFGWYIAIFPYGLKSSEEDDSEYVGWAIFRVFGFKNVTVRFSLTFLNTEGQKLYSAPPGESAFPEEKGIGCKRLIKRSELVAALKDDELVVHIVLSYNSSIVYCSDDCGNSYSVAEIVPAIRLVDDFSSLFADNLHSDITISVDGKDIPANKSILMSRSKYFAKMFEHDMLEKKTNRIVITDFDYDTVFSMLKFLYTGEMIEFDEALAADLLRIADKYDLCDMKSYFSHYFIVTLNLKNAIDIVILADDCNATKLREEAVEFIVANRLSFDFDKHRSDLEKCPSVLFDIFKLLNRTEQSDHFSDVL